MALSAVHLSLPSPSLFVFPPSSDPQPLRPPPAGLTPSTPPFTIPPPLYDAVLDGTFPITLVCLYAAAVAVLNAYNTSRENRPWSISKTRAFFYFVVAHNVFLALYSSWTFLSTVSLLKRVVQNPTGQSGVVGMVDSLCKIHGSSGLGNAVSFHPELARWVSEPLSKATIEALPNLTDTGRFWNEGLAFYGWLFYMSKFYEILDTAIILAKGKRSSTLQTYHHAGVIIIMWANMRFMCSPFWIGMLMNTGIHALMYTYYTLTILAVPVPQALKKSLTTIQIVQFITGALYAIIHLFISYTIQIEVLDAIPLVANARLPASIVSSSRPIEEYHTETVPCINTSGQMFSILLNVFYLAPLTVLFLRFFFRIYIKRNLIRRSDPAMRQGKAEESSLVRSKAL